MAKKNKITIASVMKAMDARVNASEPMVIGDGENQVSVLVKKRLTIFERADMVNSIASMVWSRDENGDDRFAPYLRKFAYDFNILNYFTNIDLPDDMGKVWDFVDNIDIAAMIIDFVGQGYIEGIIREANEEIEYRKMMSVKRSKIDELFDSINSVVKAANLKTENLDLNGLLDIAGTIAPELKGELEKIIKAQIDEESKDNAEQSAE